MNMLNMNWRWRRSDPDLAAHEMQRQGQPCTWTALCYNFFPVSHILPCLCSMPSLFLLCSSIQGDQLLPTCLSISFRPLYNSSLVSSCSTGLSHSLVTSLMVTTFPLPSTSFYDLPLRESVVLKYPLSLYSSLHSCSTQSQRQSYESAICLIVT